MASRRSSRLQGRQAIEPADPVPAPDLTVHPTKRKASASKVDALFPPPKSKQAKPPGPKAQAVSKPRNAKKLAVQPVTSVLPQEIFDLILDQITDPSTIGKMGRTCKKYHSIMIPRLHQRVAVTAMFHAHIQKLIQSIEPYLSISQMKTLKKKGKYKGQQETYSPHLAEHQVPECASFVRQMIIGVCDPGRKHEHIVYAYLDEAFKNMRNLQIVETMPMTKSIAQSLATMEHLQALSIDLSKFDPDARPFLGKIKNLKHFSVTDNSFLTFHEHDLIPQIVINSNATLRSLIVIKPNFGSMPTLTAPSRAHQFPNLKSLSLGRTNFDTDFSKWLQRSIDFMSLRELYLQPLGEGQASFFDHLATLAASKASSEIALRTVFLDLSNGFTLTPGSNQLHIDARIRFLSSFDTLTSLELNDYNQHKIDLPNPGIPETLLDAILKHKGLRTLKISYVGLVSGCKVPCISAESLTTILDRLPLLEEVHFAPEIDELDEIGRVLARSANLKSITCFPVDPPGVLRSESSSETVLKSILQASLSHNADASNSKAKFVWEDHTKLREISVVLRSWQVRSHFFGRTPKGAKKPEMFTSEGRGVMYRDVSWTVPSGINLGFDPTHPWVEKVARDMD
ncbi:unnamed protein product [Clonostachys rosea f. rosea IK726]|uniref:F-box domain-containing protein n=2 Tax=Bionectria ochroleuca TaxID=29856 RepID=A0A0B7JN46_BIOOC|nr:unnamed protein product [Clonostachys rosea f. rosea IK726]